MAKADIFRAYGTGNLTRDPEQPTEGVTKLRVASNMRVKQGEGWGDHTNYVDLTVFGAPADWAMDDLSKGDHVAFDGRLKYREWKDKDGNTRSAYEVLVDTLDYRVERDEQPQQRASRPRKGDPDGAGGRLQF